MLFRSEYAGIRRGLSARLYKGRGNPRMARGEDVCALGGCVASRGFVDTLGCLAGVEGMNTDD